MSEEFVGQQAAFLEGHQAGIKEGYLKALEDISREINGVPAMYNTITVELINSIVDKLKETI